MPMVAIFWHVSNQFRNLQFDSNDPIQVALILATLAPDLALVIEMDLRDPLEKVSIGFGSFRPVS